MTIIYRPAEPNDIPGAASVYAAAVNEINQRHGFGDQLVDSVPSNPFYDFSVREEPEGFWVAQADTEIVGMAISWLRGSFWFLACLFISPAYQNQGIGRGLLDRALKYGSRSEVTNRALITFAYNRTSTALYMGYGLYPREPLYQMTGNSATVRLVQDDTEAIDHEKLPPDSGSVVQLCHIDEQVLGVPLEKHHRYLLNSQKTACYVFQRDGVPEGYAYVSSNGHVGPLAVRSPASFKQVMNTTLAIAAAQDTPYVSVLIPGSNEQAVAIGLEHRLRIALPYLLMSSRPFGNWGTYLFHSPTLM